MLRRTSQADGLEQAAQLLADDDDVIRRILPCGYRRAPNSVHLDLTRRDWLVGGNGLELVGDMHSHPGSSSLRPSRTDKRHWSFCASQAVRGRWLSLISTAPQWGRPDFAAFITDINGTTSVPLEETA